MKLINKNTQLIIIILVSTVLFMEFLDLSIINTAIPTIATEFKTNPLLLKFSIVSYYLSLAIFIPISGWCADRFGTKTIFLLSVSFFTIASFLCANSHNLVELDLFRFLQGIGGAFMTPVSRIIILKAFPPKDFVKVQGFIYTPALIGTILGPFLGGIITEYLSWHWIFLINVPIGILTICVGNFVIIQYKICVKVFDWKGFVIIATGLSAVTFFICMLYNYDIVTESNVILSGIIGISLVILFIIYCLIKENAIFDFSIFKTNSFSVGFSSGVTYHLTHSAIMFVLPLMYQECLKYSPIKSGYLILPMAAASVISRGIAKDLMNRFGFYKTLLSGSTIITVCLILLGTINSHSSSIYIMAIELCYGFAIVMSGSTTSAISYIHIPQQQISSVTSFTLTFRQFFSSIGVGIASLILMNLAKLFNIKIFTQNGLEIFHYTFFVMAIFGIVATLNLLRLKDRQIKF